MTKPVVVRLKSLRGQNLACKPGECNVFATVGIGAKHITTNVVQSDNNSPVFTGLEACSFVWDGSSGLPSIDFFVWRRDELTRTHTFIGQGRANLHASKLGPRDQRIMLTTRGQGDAKLINAFGTLGYLHFVVDRDEDAPDSVASDSILPPVQNRDAVVTQESITIPPPAEEQPPQPAMTDELVAQAESDLRAQEEAAATPEPPEETPPPVRRKAASPRPASTDEEGPRRSLVLDIEGATNLIGRDMGAPGDPFAIICGLTVDDGDPIDLAQTDIEWSTNEPSWNKRFRIANLDPSIYAVELMLFDYDERGENDFLGRALLPIDFMISSSKNTMSVPLTSRVGGDVESEDRKLLAKEHRDNWGELHFGYQMETNGAAEPVKRAQSGLDSAASMADSHSRSFRNRARRSTHRGSESRLAWSENGDAFRAKVKATVLSVTGLPTDTLIYFSLAFGSSGSTTRQVVDNAINPVHSGPAGVCVFAHPTEFVADAPQEPLILEARDANLDVVHAQGSLQLDIPALAKPRTVTLTMPHADNNAQDASATILLSAELLPTNLPSRLDSHSVLQFCVKKLAGLAPASHIDRRGQSNPAAFVRVTFMINETEHEYTSPAVDSATGPGGDITFFFEPPQVELGDCPDIEIGAFIVDDNGFDECVGLTSIPFARLTASPDITLPLLPRTAANKARATGSTAIAGFVSVATRILPPRAALKGAETKSPTIIEVAVHHASGLPTTVGSGNVVVRIVNNTNPTTTPDLVTKSKPVENAMWGENEDPQRFQSTGVPESIRLSVWDSAARHGATFLGEYDCYLNLPGESVLGQVISADLRPRQDVHFYAHDLVLMNESAGGLGTIQFMVSAFTVREFEQKMRDRVAASGGGYMLHLQIAEASDTGKRAVYSVRGEVGGQTQVTHTERSINPKFRCNMRFALHYETEMLVLHLCERFENLAKDVTLAEVSLPVRAPPNGEASDTQSSWLVMRRTSADSAQPPKVLVRWRTVARQNLSDSAADLMQPVARGPRAILGSNVTPLGSTQRTRSPPRTPQPPPPPGEGVSALRDEIAELRLQLSTMRNPTPHPDPFSINIYVPSHTSLVPFEGTTKSTCADAIDAAVRHLRVGVEAATRCSLAKPGAQFHSDTVLSELLREGETVFLVFDEEPVAQPRAIPADQPPLFERGSSVPRLHRTPAPPHTTQPTPLRQPLPQSVSSVMLKLREIAAGSPHRGEPQLASVAVTLRTVASQQQTLDVATAFVRSLDLNGFMRRQQDDAELFLQSNPKSLVQALEGIVDRSRAWQFRSPRLEVAAELVEGYIPVLRSGFCVLEASEGDDAFAIASSANPNGECWFYLANQYPFGTQDVRWIDERAS